MTREMTAVDITPPTALEAETALLGAVLIDPRAYWDVAGFLRAEDFYLVRGFALVRDDKGNHFLSGDVIGYANHCGTMNHGVAG